MNSLTKLKLDNVFKYIFLAFTILCASSIIFIILFIVIKGLIPFFTTYQDGGKLNFLLFLFTTNYVATSYGIFGAFINTIYVTFLATLIALPVSVLTALFIVKIAPKYLSKTVEITIELLASIPSVIFGLFGRGVINKITQSIALAFGFQSMGGQSVLSVVFVLAFMMIPTITMLSIQAIKAVKKSQIEASLALGATVMQTNFKVVLKGARSGIFAALILGVGRALGEATAVSMVAGNIISGPNFGLFDMTRTLTSTMMLGLHESTGLEYDIRFTVGIVLIFVIIASNYILSKVKSRMERV